MSATDDVLESWEDIEESGALDKKLDALQLNAVEALEEIESSSFRTNHNANTRMIILGDDGMRSQYVPPKPTVKILKRPSRDSGSGDGPLMNGEKPKQPIKSLKQREQEYAEARKRILGEERSPEENPPLMNGDKSKQPIRSLKQREQEYAEARKRILGEERISEDKVVPEINRTQPKSSTQGGSNLPCNIVRMPIGPDGTRGFNVRR